MAAKTFEEWWGSSDTELLAARTQEDQWRAIFNAGRDIAGIEDFKARITELEAEVERQATLREMHQRYQKDAEADRDKAVAVADKKALRVSALGTENARIKAERDGAVKLLMKMVGPENMLTYKPTEWEGLMVKKSDLDDADTFLTSIKEQGDRS